MNNIESIKEAIAALDKERKNRDDAIKEAAIVKRELELASPVSCT